jgi:hypothetical protein
MIITFSKKYAESPSHRPLADVVVETVENVGVRKYRLTWEHDSPIGNLLASITWSTGRRVRFTLETRDAWKHGSRTAASGRHMRKASWEAHRDVLTALFDADPDATVKTALATYRGRKHFHDSFPATAHKNCGSVMQPVTIRECSVAV